MDDDLTSRVSRPSIVTPAKSALGVFLVIVGAFSATVLLFFAGGLLLSAVSPLGVVLGVLGILLAKLLMSGAVSGIHALRTRKRVDYRALVRSVERMLLASTLRAATSTPFARKSTLPRD